MSVEIRHQRWSRALGRDLETVKGNIRKNSGCTWRAGSLDGPCGRQRWKETGRKHFTWHEQIEWLAYKLWEKRGKPIGSPEVDWFRAERFLQERSNMIDSYGFITPGFDLRPLPLGVGLVGRRCYPWSDPLELRISTTRVFGFIDRSYLPFVRRRLGSCDQ